MNQEWENRRVEENPEWQSLGLTNEKDEMIDSLMEKNKICYYCHHEVEADYGQTQVYCNHCQTITQAVRRTL